jgi:hypothetical protein
MVPWFLLVTSFSDNSTAKAARNKKRLGVNCDIDVSTRQLKYTNRILQSIEWGKLNACGQEFVSVYTGRDTALSAVWFSSHHLRKASNIDVTGECYFTGQSKNEFQGRARLKIRFTQKIEAAKTDIPRSALLFTPSRFGGTNRQR